MSERSKKIAAWSSYWADGNITSLPNLYPANYDREVLEFWAAISDELEDKARVLDICTGNGAIAMLIRDNLDRRGVVCDIHAIDAAAIHPAEQGQSTGLNVVRFHAGTAVEQTHFPNTFFDLIVGQFALEYCDLQRAIKELSRITSSGGRIVLMMHHEGSVTVSKTADLINMADYFLETPTVFDRLRKYEEEYSRQGNRNAARMARLQRRLSASLDRAGELLERYPKDRFVRATLGEIRQFVGRIHQGLPGQAAAIGNFESAVRHYLIRVRDQRDAALNAKEVLALGDLLQQHGFREVSCEPFHFEGQLFAWTLSAIKSVAVHDAEHQR